MDRDLRWVVDAAGSTLAQVMQRMGAADAALAEGRVFVDRQRANSTDADRVLSVGEAVTVYRERAAAGVRVLQEHEGLIAVLKPAGISTQPDQRGSRHCVLGELAAQLDIASESLHALHRLDRGVSGVLLVARDEAARVRALAAREAGEFKRRYLALAARVPQPASGLWDADIGRGKRPGLRRVGGPQAQSAQTRYEAFARAEDATGVCLLRVEPQTGRTHQIRVHAAHAGSALVGDADYGGPRRVTLPGGAVREIGRIALHAALVEVRLGAQWWRVQADLPQELQQLWSDLSGAPGAWQSAFEQPWL